MCMLTTVFSATFLVFLSSSRRDSCACLLPVSLSRKQRLENCRCVSVWPRAAAVRVADADECQSLERHCNWSAHTLWISRLRSFVLTTDDSVILRSAFPLNLSSAIVANLYRSRLNDLFEIRTSALQEGLTCRSVGAERNRGTEARKRQRSVRFKRRRQIKTCHTVARIQGKLMLISLIM